MEKFIIKVDLSRFFEDARKNVIILVDPKWLKIEKLQGHVEEMFDLKGVFFKTTEGSLVPAQESIEIVKFLNEIKAFTGKLKSKHKLKSMVAPASSNDVDMEVQVNDDVTDNVNESAQQKRKFVSIQHESITDPPNTAKRLKNISTTMKETKHNNESNEITSTKNDTIVGGKEINIEQPVANELEPNTSADVQTQLEPRSNKKQKKKKTATNKANSCISTTSRHHKNTISFASSTFIESKSHNKSENICHTGNTHKYFSDTANASEEEERYSNESQDETHETLTASKHRNETAMDNVIFRCLLDDQACNTPRVFQPNVKKQKSSPIEITEQIIISDPLITITGTSLLKSNVSEGAPKEQIDENATVHLADERKESINKSVNGNASNMNESSIVAVFDDNDEGCDEESAFESVIELNETEDVEESAKANITTAIENILPLAEDLSDDLPANGDILIFKLHCFKKNIKVTSNYMAGSCQYINKRTKTVKLCIVDGKDEVTYLPAQLYCNMDESDTENPFLNVRIADMIDPKLFKMT